MDQIKINFCRLCLNVIEENKFGAAENIVLEMLDVLLFKINCSITEESGQICVACLKTLEKLFFFKSTCLVVEDLIYQNGGSGKINVDLKEMYRDLELNNTVTYPVSHELCRFCLKFFDIKALKEIQDNEFLKGVFRDYYPELHLNYAKTLFACEICKDRLTLHSKFAKNCLETEKNINSYYKTTVRDKKYQIDLGCVLSLLEDNGRINLVNEDQKKIQHRKQMKSNRENVENVKFGNTNNKTESDESKSININKKLVKAKVSKLSCKKCSFTTNETHELDKHSRRHKANKYVSAGKPHKPEENSTEKLKLKRGSRKKMYKCGICDFKSKYRAKLYRHKILHKDISEKETVKLFKCKYCDYTAKWKASLKRHVVKHDTPESVTYQCANCEFQTKHKASLKTHMAFQHRRPSEIQLHECNCCSYKSWHKGNLKKHMKRHKSLRS